MTEYKDRILSYIESARTPARSTEVRAYSLGEDFVMPGVMDRLIKELKEEGKIKFATRHGDYCYLLPVDYPMAEGTRLVEDLF